MNSPDNFRDPEVQETRKKKAEQLEREEKVCYQIFNSVNLISTSDSSARREGSFGC